VDRVTLTGDVVLTHGTRLAWHGRGTATLVGGGDGAGEASRELPDVVEVNKPVGAEIRLPEGRGGVRTDTMAFGDSAGPALSNHGQSRQHPGRAKKTLKPINRS
jgi:hypothetical protein